MTIHLHIDRMVVDGLGVSTIDGASLQRSVSVELGRLLSAGNWSSLGRNESLAVLRGESFAHHAGDTPRQLGRGIAGAVHGSLQQVGQSGQLRRERS